MMQDQLSRSRFQSFAEASERAEGPGRLAALRKALKKTGARRFPRAESRRASERICAEIGRAFRLAHRLHRLGGALRRAARRSRRFSSMGATPCKCARRSIRRPSRPFRPSTFRSRIGSRIMRPRMRRSALIPRFIRRTRSSVWARPLARAGARLVAVRPNPIDAIWVDRPEPPSGAVVLHDMKFAGESAADKIKRVQAALEKEKLDALVVSDPHALCWLFNIRGGDAAHTPLVIGYAILRRERSPEPLPRWPQARQCGARIARRVRRGRGAGALRGRIARARRHEGARAA